MNTTSTADTKALTAEMRDSLFTYLLRLADTSLILGHRLSELCGHGISLEDDISNTNTALDLIGQAQYFYRYAATVEGKGRTEDDLAYLRNTNEYYNSLLVELPNGHFGVTMAKQFLFDAFFHFYLKELSNSSDKQLAAIARKTSKEVDYHLRRSSQWIIMLGDGTPESHQKVQEAINDIWMYTGELFSMDLVDEALIEAGIAVDLNKIKLLWFEKVKEIFSRATLQIPEDGWMQKGGKQGRHTEHLSYLLSEMQSVKRQFPDAKW